MSALETLAFSPTECQRELTQFKALLDSKVELGERKEILPFFKKSKHLSAFLGSYLPNIVQFDRVATEFDVFGDFACDVMAGDSHTSHYIFVEFENAEPNSVFREVKGRKTPEYALRFEHGFSQLIDWFWRLEEEQRGDKLGRIFGVNKITAHGLLVVGRNQNLKQPEIDRLRWRQDNVKIGISSVSCRTFDDLYTDLAYRLPRYGSAAAIP